VGQKSSNLLTALMIVALAGISGYFVYRSQPREIIEDILTPTSSPAQNPPESGCAKTGEIIGSYANRNKNILPKSCCSGLKAISLKQPVNQKNPQFCAQTMGASICSPCGNGVCDSQYEDHCNCPQDCK